MVQNDARQILEKRITKLAMIFSHIEKQVGITVIFT